MSFCKIGLHILWQCAVSGYHTGFGFCPVCYSLQFYKYILVMLLCILLGNCLLTLQFAPVADVYQQQRWFCCQYCNYSGHDLGVFIPLGLHIAPNVIKFSRIVGPSLSALVSTAFYVIHSGMKTD